MKHCFTAMLLFWFTCTFAQSNHTAQLSGNLPYLAGTSVILTGPNHFNTPIAIDEGGHFTTTLPKIDSGYYHLDTLTFYLQPGMKLTINKSGKNLLFKGNGSLGNSILGENKALIGRYLPVKGKYLSDKANMMEPDTFLLKVNDYRNEALSGLNSQTISPYFLRTQQQNINYLTKYYINLYAAFYGIDPARQSKYLAYVGTLKPTEIQSHIPQIIAMMDSTHVKKLSLAQRKMLNQKVWQDFSLNNGEMLNASPAYTDLVEAKITQLAYLKQTHLPASLTMDQNALKFGIVKDTVTNLIVREYLLHEYTLAMIRSGKNVDTAYQNYLAAAVDTAFIADIKTTYTNAKHFVKGVPSPLFSYLDVQGHTVDLANLKGNYVYIDIWAQWCEPCKNEIPFLKAIEKKYDGKHIRFISLSVDKQSDANKWKKYVAENHLSGLQVIADKDFRSDFIQKYAIASIPRFILIGPDGQIISADADRPSNPALQTLLDSLLSAK